MVLADRELKLHEIADTSKISEGSVFAISCNHLSIERSVQNGYRVCLQLIKNNSSTILERCLELFQRGKTDYFI